MIPSPLDAMNATLSNSPEDPYAKGAPDAKPAIIDRLKNRFPDFEWHAYSSNDLLIDVAAPLLERVEELEGKHAKTLAILAE
jgi:hypothetical protein